MTDPVTLIGFGGAAGAIARYSVTQLVADDRYPYPTLIVNVIGSFILGVLIVSNAGTDAMLTFGVGFCGAFTTFSSFSFETVQLWESGDRQHALIHPISNLSLSLFGFILAWVLLG